MNTNYRILVTEVRKYLNLADAIDLRVGGITTWACPPIAPHMTLGELDLNEFTGIRVKRTDLEIIGVYEEFVHGFLAGDELADNEPRQWLCTKLGITKRAESWAMPKDYTSKPFELFTLLLWVAKCNLAGSTWSVGSDHIVVTHNERRIGYEAGKLLSSYPVQNSPTPINFELTLANHHKVCGDITTRLKEFEYYARKLDGLDVSAEVEMAIRIMIWGGREITDVARSIHNTNIVRVNGKTRFKDIGRITEQLRIHVVGASNGVRTLRRLRKALVPTYLTRDKFQDQFGNAYRDRNTEKNKDKWLRMLDVVEEKVLASQVEDH